MPPGDRPVYFNTDTDDLEYFDAGTWTTVPGGSGAVDSVNGQTGTVTLDASDVGADPTGTAAALVDDLSGVSNAATARTNLGLGTAATHATTDYDAAGTASSAVSTHSAATDPHGDRAYALGLVDDLSGVSNASTARTNLGLGTAATHATTDYDAAGTATSAVSAHAGASDPHGDRAYADALVDDLSGVSNAATARTNLGLGTAATHATGDYDASGAAAAAQAASQPLDSDLTAIAALTPSNDDFVQRKAGAWTNRTVAQVRADIDTNTTPSTQAFSDAATVGTSGTFARGDHKHAMPASPLPLGLFGDGSDSAVAFDGTNTFAFASTTGAAPNLVYTLTRDVYATTLSVSAGKIVNTGGFRILATTSITNAGTIQNNGSDAANNTAGGAAPGGTVGGGGAGANAPASGTTTTAGSNSSNTNAGYHSLGGRGGVGGNANPGTAGTLSTIARMPSFRDLGAALTMCWSPPAAAVTSAPAGPIVAGGGTGGSGGGRTTGATATTGGAGGGGGGGVWMASPTITNTGATIQANGGNGAAASGAGACVTGGGGGGGGGFVMLIYRTLAAGTEQALGGTKGAPLNGAAAANDGGTGNVFKIPLA